MKELQKFSWLRFFFYISEVHFSEKDTKDEKVLKVPQL